MNVLFLSVAYPREGNDNMYADIMYEFHKNGHKTYVACACQRRENKPETLTDERGTQVLRLKTGNITGNVNLIEKGVSTLLMDNCFVSAIKKHFGDINFDLIIYSTPPVAFIRTLKWLRKHNNAKICHLLKDIFPQSAVDMGMLGESSPVYKNFRKKEIQLYHEDDLLGCTSQRNIDYVLAHNPGLDEKKLFITRNVTSFEALPAADPQTRKSLNMDETDTLFLFGGNLGKPQGIDAFLKFCDALLKNEKCHVVVAGSGTQSDRIAEFARTQYPKNMHHVGFLQKKEYKKLLAAADVGLIFLDSHYTVPNDPMRYTEYLYSGLPMVAATDRATDLSVWIEDYKLGCWSESLEQNMEELAERAVALTKDAARMSECAKNARELYENEYTADQVYNAIMSRLVNP